jgi:drug/metabolite transporter (DMT)-like permease
LLALYAADGNTQYMQLVFALVIERVVWGTTPAVESLVGSLFIIGAAVWVSLEKNVAASPLKTDEERPLLQGRDQARNT